MRLKTIIKRVTSVARGRLERVKNYLEIARAGEIARRKFANNAFDGALTILGVIVGAVVAKEADPRVIIGAGVGASLAMGISGAFGAYITERAESRRSIKELEKQMFTNLNGSIVDRASKTAALWLAFVDGISPALAAVIPLIPFGLVLAQVIPVEVGLASAFILNLSTLFVLGVFLGKMSKGNIWVYGALMVGAGVLTTLLLIIFV